MVPLLMEVAIEQRVSFVYYYILQIESASVWVFDVDILKKFFVFKQINHNMGYTQNENDRCWKKKVTNISNVYQELQPHVVAHKIVTYLRSFFDFVHLARSSWGLTLSFFIQNLFIIRQTKLFMSNCYLKFCLAFLFFSIPYTLTLLSPGLICHYFSGFLDGFPGAKE